MIPIASGAGNKQFERNEGKEYDDIIRNEFIAYVMTAFYRCRARYIKHQLDMVIETKLEPEEMARLMDAQSFKQDQYAAENAGFSPVSWQEVMDSIENPKLDTILSQLTEEEQELMLYRLFYKLSYKEIARRKQKGIAEVETRYDTLIRKLRRKWKKED